MLDVVLHPRHKLAYFKKAGWDAEWIDAAELIVREEYERSYAIGASVSDGYNSDQAAEHAAKEKVRRFICLTCSSLLTPRIQANKNIFDDLPSLAAPHSSELRDELDLYLASDPVFTENALHWWHERRSTFPCLSRMALDYLSIPGQFFCFLIYSFLTLYIATSVAVERVFSRGRILLSHIRNRLNAQTTRALLCLGSWSLLDLVKDIDVLTIAQMPGVEGDKDLEMDDGWDSINIL